MRPLLASHNGSIRISRGTDHLSGWLIAVSLLVALLLAATLVGPSAYLIARNAGAAAEYGGPDVQRSGAAGDRIDQRSDGDGETKPSPSPKRPKGALKLGNEANKAFAFVASSGNLVRIEDPDTAHEPTTAEAEPGNILLPPQLLQRPPPVS